MSLTTTFAPQPNRTAESSGAAFLLCDRYVIGAYEVKTAKFVRMRGILGVWPQAVLEALALNHMANRSDGRYFIPVFGGDFNEHLVVHAAPTQDDFVLHAATQSEPTQADLAVRYMRYLLEKSKEAVMAGLQGNKQSHACSCFAN